MSSISKNPTNFLFIETGELLSFHFLKAHLKTFKGTVFEKDINELQSKLELLAPGEVFLDNGFYWDQNTGQYDYSDNDKILRKVIASIVDKKWLRVRYHSANQGTEKEYNVLFCGLFAYSGTLYVVTYFRYYDNYEALALQGIINIEPSKRTYKVKSKFNFKKFTKKRYGVFTGKVFTVKLQIDKKYREYFICRSWHTSQKTFNDENGNLIIEMRVPIGMDLVSWILSWNNIIRVIKPKKLREKVLLKAKAVIEMYE